MNKILLIVGLALVAQPVFADQTLDGVRADENFGFNIPQGKDGTGADVFAKWSLAKLGTVEFSASASNIEDGGLLLDGGCVTSTNIAGGYSAVYDSDEAGSVVLGDSAFSHVVRIVAKVIGGASQDTTKSSCEFFPVPIPLRHGLSVINSHADIRSSWIYRRIKYDR